MNSKMATQGFPENNFLHMIQNAMILILVVLWSHFPDNVFICHTDMNKNVVNNYSNNF